MWAVAAPSWYPDGERCCWRPLALVGRVELEGVWGSGWTGRSCLPASTTPSSLSLPSAPLSELESQSSRVTPFPLPCSSRPLSPASSCGAATLTTPTSARPRRGPHWTGPSVHQARYLQQGRPSWGHAPGSFCLLTQCEVNVCGWWWCWRADGSPCTWRPHTNSPTGTSSLLSHTTALASAVGRSWRHLIDHPAEMLAPISQMSRLRPRQIKEVVEVTQGVISREGMKGGL